MFWSYLPLIAWLNLWFFFPPTALGKRVFLHLLWNPKGQTISSPSPSFYLKAGLSLLEKDNRECVIVPASQRYFNWYVVNKGCGEVLGNFSEMWVKKKKKRSTVPSGTACILNLHLCNFPISRHPCEGTFKNSKREKFIFPKMFADLHSIKTNEPSFRDDRLSGIVKMIRAAHCSAGGAGAFHPQKRLSQHLLRKFRFRRVTEAAQKYQYSRDKLISLFCSLALVPSLSLSFWISYKS